MLTKQGIKANLTKCQAIIDMKSLINVRKVQALNDRLKAFTRFISKSIDNHAHFFFYLLKNNKPFEWTNKYEEAFKKLKEYLVTPLILT